jgi:dihydropteroate synthase
MPKTKLMGILNVTPDSFYDGNSYFEINAAIERGIEIYRQGADILDIGGESTRPGSNQVHEQEEIERVIPVIQSLKQHISIPISIDTTKPSVALAAVEAGATMINDINGFRNPKMREIASLTGVEVCVMHMLGEPKTMQLNPLYPNGILFHLLQFFEAQISLLINAGIQQNKIILDPGIGFGKTIADNLEIIHNLHQLKDIGFPLLVGVSRKSFMSKLLNKPSSELLAATLAMNVLVISAGVDIIRVHDIREHDDVIQLLSHIERSKEK